MSLHVTFEQAVDNSILTVPPVTLVTEQFEVYNGDGDLSATLATCSKQLQNRIDAYENLGSGWVVRTLHSIDTTVWKLDPLRAETYHQLSKWIRNTKCVVNVKNTGNDCFINAIYAGLYQVKSHSNCVSSYTKFYGREDSPITEGLVLPMRIDEQEE